MANSLYISDQNFIYTLDIVMPLRGDRIRERRKRAGLTQDQLARKVGVQRQSIVLYEGNKSAPDTETLGRIVHELKTNHSYLAGEINYPNALTERHSRLLSIAQERGILSKDEFEKIWLEDSTDNNKLPAGGQNIK